jgi:hypothetical protein
MLIGPSKYHCFPLTKQSNLLPNLSSILAIPLGTTYFVVLLGQIGDPETNSDKKVFTDAAQQR